MCENCRRYSSSLQRPRIVIICDEHSTGKMSPIIWWLALTSLACRNPIFGNEASKRLFEDLLLSYNKLSRPVSNASDSVKVKFKLKLAQLLDVHEKNQIMTTNMWLKQCPFGPRKKKTTVTLILILRFSSIILTADGKYQVTIATKAAVHYSGRVRWEPPAIYKSMCQIDVEWYVSLNFPLTGDICHDMLHTVLQFLPVSILEERSLQID
uniref:Neurotransmitter-gated ion-channel ligand-binding domain-containing protein n=1 Tax=Romanomermis culicivorax TaxID=13658 RepID=A0A915IL95_ROMCU